MGRHARKSMKPDEEDVFCPNCGTRNPKDARTCSSCGGSL